MWAIPGTVTYFETNLLDLMREYDILDILRLLDPSMNGVLWFDPSREVNGLYEGAVEVPTGEGDSYLISLVGDDACKLTLESTATYN